MAESGSGEPATKKLRADISDTIFEEFRSNNSKCLKLKNALESPHVIGVAFLRVSDTNAKSPVSLSKATCNAHEIWVDEQFPACMSFRSIFTFGYKLLNDFLTSGNIPTKEMYKEALRKLLQFLLYDKEGCVKGWRGELDILIGKMPVKVAQNTEDSSFDENSFEESKSQSSLSAEVKKDNFSKNDLNQMLAQTILFSFYKGKGLIPLVGLGSSFVKLHFYDCEKDFLMRSNTVNFLLSEEHGSFETKTILMLWLTLNYELLCAGVSDKADKYKKFKAEFHEKLGSHLECYKNTTAPFPFQLKAHAEEKEPTYNGYFDDYEVPDITM